MLRQLQFIEIPFYECIANLTSSFDCGLRYGLHGIDISRRMNFVYSTCHKWSWEGKRRRVRIRSSLYIPQRYVPLLRHRVIESDPSEHADVEDEFVIESDSDVRDGDGADGGYGGVASVYLI